MPNQVCTGALMQCSCGMAPSTFNATTTLPQPVLTSNQPAGTIMDFIPIVNIPPFGMCMSPANPLVAAATAAAFGVLTPMPCIPMTVSPWVPGAPNVLINNFAALDDVSTLMCNWAGTIKFIFAGQVTHQIP
jgi:hypothetical protein